MKLFVFSLIFISSSAVGVSSVIRYDGSDWYCARYLGIGKYSGLEARTYEFAKLYHSQSEVFGRPRIYYLKKTRDVLERFKFTGDMLAGVWLLDAEQEVVAMALGAEIAERFSPETERSVVLRLAERIAIIEDFLALPESAWPQLTLQRFVIDQIYIDTKLKIPKWGHPVRTQLRNLIREISKKIKYETPH